MQKNKIVSLVVIGVIVVGIVFYVGVKYGQSNKAVTGTGNFGQRNFQMMGSSTARGGNRMAFGGAVSGQIIYNQGNIMTVKSQDGGSRIIFLSASTTVSKVVEANGKDLFEGVYISVNGVNNSDNSINAQSIQIRPQSPIQPK